jgi:hypothetical protein
MVAAVIAALIFAPPARSTNLHMLLVSYDPPFRALRPAPPSLREPTSDADQLSVLAALLDQSGVR